jgi:hypothetical protein
MRDYNFITEDGRLIPISCLPSFFILKMLNNVSLLRINGADGSVEHMADVIARLELELLIRRLKL